MSRALVTQYERDGFFSPLDVVEPELACTHRETLESIEKQHGAMHYQYKLYTFMQFPLQLATHPALLDAVEALIGPDILLYNATFVIKEAHSDAHVSWHQDLTYWGLNSDAQVSAWVALTEVTEENGCMYMLPGSQKDGMREHITTQDSTNVLLNGQTIPSVDESTARPLCLQPGQASLHHGWTIHTSMPNRSSDRRIGLNIQYLATDVKQLKSDKDTAMLVRGADKYRHFGTDKPVAKAFDLAEMKRQEALTDHIKSITTAQAGQRKRSKNPGI
jgi:ectoine hydroxylase-related dioxygenase (phytanoyl-CoA dioxygenase family)